jgi:hypothetical protein
MRDGPHSARSGGAGRRRALRFRRLAAIPLLLGLAGCAERQLDPNLITATDVGRYGGARVALQGKLTENASDRSYILDRLRLLILTLADGQPAQAEEVANQTFRLLRTQGLNADRTTASIVLNEDIKIWKGEPFEQALSYTYIAIQKAELGQWDNARAAANASLFLLKDFGHNERGQEMSNIEVARRAAEQDARSQGAGDRYINKGYTPIKTNFVLGYLLNGLSNRALAREDEANDNFHEAAAINAAFEPLAKELSTGTYNTVFIVDYGRGPEKIATGPDNAFSRFVPRSGGASPIHVEVAQAADPEVIEARRTTEPPIQDINRMASSLMWNNLEDVRRAKSVIGSTLVAGGLATAAYGSQGGGGRHHDDTLVAAGLAAAVAGMVMKSTAHADTRYAEFLPQRVYVVPVNITTPQSVVTLEVENDSTSRLVFPAMDPPDPHASHPLQLRYVRMSPVPQQWDAAGKVVYGNDFYKAPVPGDTLPYILGGHDASTPSQAALHRYQSAGNLTNLTTVELENLYREEGIALTPEDQHGRSRKHILEGGDSLVPPLPGTIGYLRLFNQPHEPYKPKSKAVQDLVNQQPANH